MNLPIFLKKVDEIAANLSQEELRKFVHEIARTLAEGKRSDFINTLKLYDNSLDNPVSEKFPKDDGYSELLKNIEEIKVRLIEINEGIRLLDSEYNPEWDDWYNSDADEVLFRDPTGVIKDIERAMDLIHSCVDMEAYQEGSELADMLSVVEVSAEGDYNDFDGSPLYIHELSSRDLLSCDFKNFVKECLYLTYMGNPLEERGGELLRIMGNFECYDIRLEDILQFGTMDLPDADEFLLKWIDYLGMQKGRGIEALLKEAQGMVQDDTVLIENARKYANEHPDLYEQILRMKLDSGNNDEMLRIGMEALDKVPDSYVIRSGIALLTAEYACKLKDHDIVEKCWVEAFRSDTNVINYLRIRFMTREWGHYEAEVKLIYEQTYKRTASANRECIYDRNAQRENTLYKNDYCVMLFFDEQFDRVLATGMKEKNALGWSVTFMKQGLALFLLLLFEGRELPTGLKEMLNRGISACSFELEKYSKGTDESFSGNNSEEFWKMFCQWKKHVQLSESERKKWLERIDKWIALRVAGVMENNRRNYYGECAEYIAAFGEVQESLGVISAKARMLEKYKNEYPRRRSFHQELRTYGLRK